MDNRTFWATNLQITFLFWRLREVNSTDKVLSCLLAAMLKMFIY